MAYDEALADRVRALVIAEPMLSEQVMFGGLAFLIGRNMAVGVSGRGGLLVRVRAEESEALLATSAAEPMEMGSRQMRGWLRVPAGEVEADDELSRWVERGVRYARSLPPKT